jgi:hypothetical protein
LDDQVEGGILIGIVASTLVYFSATGDWPSDFVQMPTLESSIGDNIDLGSLTSA